MFMNIKKKNLWNVYEYKKKHLWNVCEYKKETSMCNLYIILQLSILFISDTVGV